MTNRLILILIFFINIQTSGQNANPFLGVWVKKGSVPDNLIEDPFSDNKFLKYDFRENEVVYRSNSYLERGVPSKYRVTNEQKLSLNYIFHKIIMMTETELIISDDQNNVIHLIKVSDPLESFNFPESKSNAVYRSNFKFHPTITSNIDLYNYFFSVSEYMDVLTTTHNVTEAINTMNYNVGPSSEDIFVKINFTVDKKGNVKDVRVIESTNPKKESKYASKIATTSGHWTPAILNNEFVDTELTLTFKKLGIKTVEKYKKADVTFNKGVRHFDKGDYAESIDLFTEALTINPTNPRYLLFRAKAYLGQKDSKRACDDLNRINDEKSDDIMKLIKENCK